MKTLLLTILICASCSNFHFAEEVNYAGFGYQNGEIVEEITAYADLKHGRSLEIRVHNESGQPIKTSYFLDQWAARDYKERVFTIEKGKFSSYQRKSVINPRQSATYRFRLPEGIWNPPLIVGQLGTTTVYLWKK